MTNENNIEIKKYNRFWFLKGLLCLLLMIAFIFVALAPFLFNSIADYSPFFHIVGGVMFTLATGIFIFILVKECKPSTALVLNAHGFTDRINVGDGIEIEWTNVASVKMLGKAKMPFLGITLENPEIVMENMKKYLAEEMRENTEQNLPSILIPQSDVRIQIKELKALFTKFSREARALENDVPKKPKSNPFTTDDVLRAFGKLPKDESQTAQEENNKEEEISSNIDNTNTNENFSTTDTTDVSSDPLSFEFTNNNGISDFNTDNPIVETSPIINVNTPAPFSVPEDITSQTTIQGEKKVSASDSFYEALRAKAAAKPDVVASSANAENQNSTETTDSMPEDMKELLSKARSSKISEIEKLLTDSEVPFVINKDQKEQESTSNEEQNSPVLSNEESSTDVTENSEIIDDSSIESKPVDEDGEHFSNTMTSDSDEPLNEAQDTISTETEFNKPVSIPALNEFNSQETADGSFEEEVLAISDTLTNTEITDDKHETEIETTLESLIASALKETSASDGFDIETPQSNNFKFNLSNHDFNADTKEFIIDPSFKKDQ